jgi:TonB family protein
MKRLFIISLLMTLAMAGLQAQTTTYYKSVHFKKVVPENNARYKTIWYAINDTAVMQAYEIKGARFLFNYKFLKGKPVGIWYSYNKKGKQHYRWNFNELFYSDAPVKNKFNSSEKSYKLPLFQGGDKGLRIFILNNIYYPDIEAQSLHHKGTVEIRIYVDSDGTAVPCSIIKGVDPFLDLEAWELVKKMPKWTPGEVNGKPIQVMVSLHFDIHPGVGIIKGMGGPYYGALTRSPNTPHSPAFRR